MYFLRLTGLAGLLGALWFTPSVVSAAASITAANAPVEVDTQDAKLAKIILIAGPSQPTNGVHDYLGGSVVLMKALRETRGVFPVLVRDGWPKNEAIFTRAKAIVYYGDGGENHPFCKNKRPELIGKLAHDGVGLVHLHTAADYPSQYSGLSTTLQGGFYDRHLACRAPWPTTFQDFISHPTTRGLKPFSYHDCWPIGPILFSEKKGYTAILSVMQTFEMGSAKEKSQRFVLPEDVAWTFDRKGGGRSFTFVGGHVLEDWAEENFRRLIVNGILWTAQMEVPKTGAKVKLPAADLPEKKLPALVPTPKPASKK